MGALVGRAVSAVLMFLLTAGAPAHATVQYYGLTDDSTLAGQLKPLRDAQLIAGTGANSARITVDWSYVEKAPGALNLALYDPIYQAWTSAGIRPILVVTGAPAWARDPAVACPPDQTCHAPPTRQNDVGWFHFVGAVARRYPLAAAIEVWNEPNYGGFWLPAPDPDRYSQLLRLAYLAVKAANPAMPVLGGSLASDVSNEESAQEWGIRPFLHAMYRHRARGTMDGISLHPYPNNRADGGVYDAIDAALEARDDARDHVPLWLTEVGASSTDPALGETGQATLLGDLVPRLLRRPDVKGVYVYTLIDTNGASGLEAGYGLVRLDQTLKPAYCTVAAAFGIVPPCATPTASPDQVARWDAQERVQAAAEAALRHFQLRRSYHGFVVPAGDGVGASDMPDVSDGVQLCDKLLPDPKYCIGAVHGGPWRFTARSSDGTVTTW